MTNATTTPALTLQAREAGGIFHSLGMTDEAQFLAHFGRAVATGRVPVTAAMLERADGLIGIAAALADNPGSLAA